MNKKHVSHLTRVIRKIYSEMIYMVGHHKGKWESMFSFSRGWPGPLKVIILVHHKPVYFLFLLKSYFMKKVTD